MDLEIVRSGAPVSWWMAPPEFPELVVNVESVISAVPGVSPVSAMAPPLLSEVFWSKVERAMSTLPDATIAPPRVFE